MFAVEPKSILIVKMSSIGDVIHALPVASALRRHFPQAQISWLVAKRARDIVVGHPHLDRVLVVGGDAANGDIVLPNLAHPFQVAHIMQEIGFDVAIDMQGLLRSGFFTLFSGAKVRIGYRSLKEAAFLLYNVLNDAPDRVQHVVERYLTFAGMLGAPEKPVEFIIATSREHEERVDALLRESGIPAGAKLVALSPGSSWKSKTWPPERLGEVADYLSATYGYIPVIVGAASDLPRAQAIIANAKGPLVDLTAKTSLKELAVLARRCQAWVGNDSGPTHLAAAVNVPIVAIYGPTDEKLLRPYGDQHEVIVAPVACRPCTKRSRAEHCKHVKCMTQIAPVQVCQALDRILARSR
jgi:lipopolysaccharide heptosyltransferase I